LDFGYPELAKKSESYEICFVPDNDYRNFLKKKVVDLEERVDGGNYVLTDGTIVGKHKGYPFYTIGQRKGLDIALGKPMFVIQIIPETNTVVLGDEIELDKSHMFVSKMNYIKYDTIKDGQAAFSKIRYKSTAVSSTLFNENGAIKSVFDAPVKGIAPGQSAVFYEGDDVVAGGIILF
jgi:tRNA-specific 2-thiouridylase